MERKLIVTKNKDQVYTALLEDHILAELHLSEKDPKRMAAGDIYIGKIKKINANIGAMFIETAPGVECYCPLKLANEPFFSKKAGKKPLCIGDELVVEIKKEASKGKIPSVTTDFSIKGRLAVLVHGKENIGVSGKIPPVRKAELKQWASGFHMENCGLILRTGAAKAEKETLLSETDKLQEQYQSLLQTAPFRTCFSCLYKAPPEYLEVFRNHYAAELTEIVTDDPDLYQEIRDFLEKEMPSLLHTLRKYEDAMLPLRKFYNLDMELTHALAEKVWIRYGGFLVIQPTEALTVIDVNSGKCTEGKDREKTFLKLNIEAAREAARQIRLRNLSGIILIDFINLAREEDTQSLLHFFREELAKDPVRTNLIDVTKLQLVEVTREKVKKPLSECVKGQTGPI